MSLVWKVLRLDLKRFRYEVEVVVGGISWDFKHLTLMAVDALKKAL